MILDTFVEERSVIYFTKSNDHCTFESLRQAPHLVLGMWSKTEGSSVFCLGLCCKRDSRNEANYDTLSLLHPVKDVRSCRVCNRKHKLHLGKKKKIMVSQEECQESRLCASSFQEGQEGMVEKSRALRRCKNHTRAIPM
jgi:hypothetical protein